MVDTLRKHTFTPYTKGKGPSFNLHMWDTGRQDNRGQTYIGYTLHMKTDTSSFLLFEGSDFAGSPLNADDSDKTVVGLMGFLTLRPGDTDADYFVEYTAEQLAYCSKHAESLQMAVIDELGED